VISCFTDITVVIFKNIFDSQMFACLSVMHHCWNLCRN